MKTVVTLGPKFSYSYNVCYRKYKDCEIILKDRIENVFEAVSKSDDLVGIVPIENLINGNVRESFISLKKYKVKISKAYDLDIKHCIASQNKDFDKVTSHPQALAQSSEYLKKYRDDGVEIIDCSSTSKAMEIAKEDNNYAGIGSVLAAKNMGLTIIDENIGNQKNNVTRFIEITKNGFDKSFGDKTSMIIEPKTDRSGLLFEILSIFKIKDINLTKIESLPLGEKIGEYIFFIDIDASIDEEKTKEAIEFLRTIVDVYLFGSYDVEKV